MVLGPFVDVDASHAGSQSQVTKGRVLWEATSKAKVPDGITSFFQEDTTDLEWGRGSVGIVYPFACLQGVLKQVPKCELN